MTLSPFDFFLIFVLVAGLPVWALRSWRRLKVQIAHEDPDARVAAYRRVIVVQWSLVAFLLVHVLLRPVTFADLRIDLPLDLRVLGAFLVSGALIMFVLGQARAALSDEETRAEARRQVESLRDILPHDARDYAWFRPVAWTAGICEELLYRGYLPWVLALAMPTWTAFLLATVVFGIGHAYQGVAGVVKTAAVGAIMAGLTWGSGTVLPAIALHVAIDAINGHLAWRLIAENADGTVDVTDDES